MNEQCLTEREQEISAREKKLAPYEVGSFLVTREELRELLATVSQLRESQRWIPVSEEPPKQEQWVMCCIRGLDYALPHYVGALPFGKQVTHWMPFPKPSAEAALQPSEGADPRKGE